jgi:hypothetical protein
VSGHAPGNLILAFRFAAAAQETRGGLSGIVTDSSAPWLQPPIWS